MANKFRVVDGERWTILDEELDKSDAIVTRDGWKQHLKTKFPKDMFNIKIEPHRQGDGLVVWEILAQKQKRRR